MVFGPGRETSLQFFASVLACTITSILCCTPIFADAMVIADVAVIADTLVVSAPMRAQETRPSTASLVTRVELDAASEFRDLNQLLGSVAGLQLARLGGWGASAVPSLRGSAAAQIQFFVDGVPLPNAQTGQANFGQIPLARLAAIEVHRGVVPVGLGGVGGAGAINLITRKNENDVTASLLAGAFGEQAGKISMGGANKAETLSGMVVLHGHRADNDYEFLDHNQTFHRSDDDTVRVRENADLAEWGAWGRGGWQSGDWTIGASLGHTQREGGRPGPLGYESPRARVRYDRLDGQVDLSWREGLVQGSVAAGRNNEYLDDPAGEVGFTPAGTTHTRSEDVYTRWSWSSEVIADVVHVSLGADGRGQWQVESIADRVDPERQRNAVGAFASLTAALADGRVTVTPAWRWQHTEDDFPPVSLFPWLPEQDGVANKRDDTSPSLGIVWEAKRQRLYFESHLSRTVRIPTWVELFGHRGGVDGNRELLPEEISAVDLAMTWRYDQNLSARLAAFYAETDDKIIFVQNSQRTSKARNLGRSDARGVEVEVTALLPAALLLSGNVTLQSVKDRSDDPIYNGLQLPFLPDIEAHARLAGNVSDWRPWLEVAHMSANYRDRANTELDKAPARTLLNVGLAHDWYPDWLGLAGVLSLAGEVVNLTDNAVYDVEGFPLPGRTWHLSLQVRK
ncbi:MAG: outer membrane cobalamin receptor [Candidatus Krumholzibacteriia bacterium]